MTEQRTIEKRLSDARGAINFARNTGALSNAYLRFEYLNTAAH